MHGWTVSACGGGACGGRRQQFPFHQAVPLMRKSARAHKRKLFADEAEDAKEQELREKRFSCAKLLPQECPYAAAFLFQYGDCELVPHRFQFGAATLTPTVGRVHTTISQCARLIVFAIVLRRTSELPGGL